MKSSREKILDTAERLFAERSYDAVSVRDITNAADVRVASINYYFNSKQGLYHEILERRANIIIREREKRLSNIPFSTLSNENAIYEICKVIIAPIFEKVVTNEPGWRAYVGVVASFVSREIQPGRDRSTLNALDKVSKELIASLQKYSVHPTDKQAHIAFQLITGSALYAMVDNGRINKLSEGEYRTDDYQSLFDCTLEFITAGVIRLLTTK